VYPALAVHNALAGEDAQVTTLWVGGQDGMEADLVTRAGIPYRSIPAAGVHGVGLRALPGNLARLARGVLAARRILRDFRPQVLFFTGGYVAAPMAVAGRNIPTALYVPDIEPGLALKFLTRFADRVAVTVPDSMRYFPPSTNLVETGYPLRADLVAWSRDRAARRIGLAPGLPTLLVTGGSKGARPINTAVMKWLKELLEMAQVIHISGSLDWPAVEAAARRLPAELGRRYHAVPYTHEMGAALAAADLVLSRAGASTLGEYPLFGLPAVLVPYPHAWRYQQVNAEYLSGRNAAVILPQDQLEQRLFPLVMDVMNDRAKLDAMRAAMKSLSRPGAAVAIARQLIELAGGKP
jgi:UDP-N-acetylglucosamine--N-acetylmuramyl-(pentapeptide) pyrophosphoryl-undecaprenol N-acetylglucosamine transferase